MVFRAAWKLYEQALAASPDDADLHMNYGYLLGSGDPDGALADWRHSHELAPEQLSSVYSSAFLLEREGRIEDAMVAWRLIIDRSAELGFTLDTLWPKQELDRLRRKAGASASQAPVE